MFNGYRSIFVFFIVFVQSYFRFRYRTKSFFVIVFVQSCCFCVKIAENFLRKVLKLNLFLEIIQRMLTFAQNFEVALA